MTRKPNPTILDLATRTQFSYEELEAAAIAYGINFLQPIIEEASRSNRSPLAIVEAIIATPTFVAGIQHRKGGR